MNRSILEKNIEDFHKFEKEQNNRKEEALRKIDDLTTRLNKISTVDDRINAFQDLIDRQREGIEVEKKRIEEQEERHEKAEVEMKEAEKASKKRPQDRELKHAFKKQEFEFFNSGHMIKHFEKRIGEIEEKIEEYRTAMNENPESIVEILEQLIAQEESIVVGIGQHLKLEQDRIDLDTRYVEQMEQNRRGSVFVFDPEIEEHQIQKALDTNIRRRIASITEINDKTIKLASKFIRAKHESASDRAEFLIRCRLYESQKEIDEADEDRYEETSEAMRTMSSWIAANAPEEGDEEEVLHKGDVRFEGDKTELKQQYEIAMKLIQNKLFLPEEKFDIAVSFFTIGAIEYCYSLFMAILKSPYTRATDKAEACKFLYYADNDEYIPEIEKYTKEIIYNNELSDRFRYETIACYVTSLGLKTKYMHTPLPVEGIDQELVTTLFQEFVKLDIHPDYKILAYTFLLEQDHDEDIKEGVEKSLLEMARSTSFPKVNDEDAYKIHRVRADAADVIVRRPDSIFHQEAFKIVMELGEQEDDLEINKTVYTNAENVHLLNEKALDYIEKIYSKTGKKFSNMESVVRDIELMAERFNLTLDDRALIRKSLDRLILDSSRFTKHKITMSTILLCIYNEINNHKLKKRIMARLLEELIDMSETCASGHAKRLVNTMVGYTDELDGIMDIGLQLEANVKARIHASIKNMEEGDEKDDVVESMIGDDRQPFLDYVERTFPDIRKELEEEFVVQGYISQTKFDECVKDVLEKL